MEKNSCYQCKDRVLNCHSGCEKYITFRKNLDSKNELIRANKNTIRILNKRYY